MKKSIEKNEFEAVVIGCSAGGLHALSLLLPMLPKDYNLPVVIILHRKAVADDYMPRALNDMARMPVKETESHDTLAPNTVYLAPANYHLLVERNRTFSLSIEPPVNFSRPAIDVTFESAARTFGDKLIGILLTGASSDGSRGLKVIQELGGLTIVQDPEEAEAPYMPRSAIREVTVDHILKLNQIGDLLIDLAKT